MIGIFTTIVIGGTLLLWLSHRVYLTYAHTVAREERARVRRGRAPVRPSGHIGPSCFLFLNCLVTFILVRGLESLAFDTSELSEIRVLLLSMTHFSGIIGLWLVLESRHLAFFYRKIGQTLPSRSRATKMEQSSRLPAFWRRNLALAFFLTAGMPLFLEILGVRVGEASRESVLLLFGTCFLLPQVCLLAFLARRIVPLRRHAGLS
ncbi:MAG: hypothetical protein ACI97A_001209 [Planctomycetota bacterium]|jgi:hypothetical protein